MRIEQFSDEHGIYVRASEEAFLVSKEQAASIRKYIDELRDLVWDLYCLAYPSAVEWEVSDAAYDKYSPCEKCHELHGGKSPCASTSKDMTEECCKPIQAVVVADRMHELGVDA